MRVLRPLIALATMAAYLGCTPTAWGQIEPGPEWFESKALFPVHVEIPEDEGPYPLLIALHGWGSSAEAFKGLGRRFVEAGYLVAVPESPYPFTPGGGEAGFDWSLYYTQDSLLQNRAGLLLVQEYIPDLVRHLQRAYAVEETYILGFSQGAIMACLTGIYNPELIHGVVSFGLPALESAWLPPGEHPWAGQVPMILLHGREDERVPARVSQAARDLLRDLGYETELLLFEGGHWVPEDQLGTVLEWLADPGARNSPER